jgi:hypothetical protein
MIKKKGGEGLKGGGYLYTIKIVGNYYFIRNLFILNLY